MRNIFLILIFAPFISFAQVPKCDAGDVRPQKMHGGGLWLGEVGCGFKSVVWDNKPLFDPAQFVYTFSVKYYDAYQIVDVRTGIVEYTGQSENHSTHFLNDQERDTIGKILIIDGAEYERYMPELGAALKKGNYNGEWEWDVSIAVCGCLRRVTIEQDIVPSKKIEYLYTGKAKPTPSIK